MRRLLPLFLISSALFAAEDHPRIRAVTAFIDIDRNNYGARIDEAAKFLAAAKTALNAAGFDGAGGRITTQPFPVYTKGMKRDEALSLIHNLREAATKARTGFNIGPAMMNDDNDTEPVSLLAAALADTAVNANIIVADEKGIHWRAVHEAARLIHQVAATSKNGDGNFNFAAIAMMKPYGPYYPGSWHNGPGKHFALAIETANVVNRVFKQYHEPKEAESHLAAELSRYTKEAETVAMKVAAATGWTYEGIDATPAPGGDNSIAAAFEAYLGTPIGSYGSMTAAGIITRAVQSTPVKRTGYSGLMIPVMEDKLLAQRWSEGTFGLDSILAWSAVCAGGVDTVPLPGDASEDQIGRIIGDVTWLAYKWNKPLGARLMPAPGKKAGEMTAFTGGAIVNTKIR
jgi:hypothetical protein